MESLLAVVAPLGTNILTSGSITGVTPGLHTKIQHAFYKIHYKKKKINTNICFAEKDLDLNVILTKF